MDCVVKIDVLAKGNELENRRDAASLTYGSLNAYWDAFGEDRLNVSGPGQVRVEMYTKILDCMLSSGSWAEVFLG